MRNDQQQKGYSTTLNKVGSFIANMFNCARSIESSQAEKPVVNSHDVIKPVIDDAMYEVDDFGALEYVQEPRESWEEAADRRIAETPLTPDRFKPRRRYFTNWSQYKLIHTLYVHGEVGRQELGEMVDIANIPDLVARANRRGWSIRCQRKGMVDASGRCRYRGYYSLCEKERTWVRAKLYLVQHGYE